jgi:cold shock CspA family protein/ribosome-associated translation inhibitor RaiA
MRPILQVHYGNINKTPSIEDLIQKKVAKLQKVCADLTSCRVSIEKPQQHQRVGNPYRVRLDLKAPGKEFVTIRESSKGDMHDPLAKVIIDAFTAVRLQLKEYKERKQGEVKFHPEQQIQAIVVRLFPGEDYGFLKTFDGREIYFHRNSVFHDDFDRLEIGTAVRFNEEMGEKGPQATIIKIVDKPSVIVSKVAETPVEPPLDW